MFLDDIYHGAIKQFMAPLLPSESLFYLYLASALLISTVTYFWFSYREEKDRPLGISKGLIGYIFDREVWMHKSARQDYFFFIVNALIYNGIVAHFLISGHVAFGAISNGFEYLFGQRTAPIFQPSLLSAVAYTATAVLATDFAIFITHYLQHKVSALWHFHSVHHSAEVLTIITVFRQHPLDLFITGTFIVLLSQLAFAGFSYMTMAKPSEFLILNVNVVMFAFLVFGYNLRHSHIWVSYPPWLSYILISPAQHQTHHSIDPKHFDRNFGFIFAIWDWAFGTLYVPRGYEKLEFGICKEEPNPYNSMVEIYVKPFQRAWSELGIQWKPTRSVLVVGLLLVLLIVFAKFAL